MKIIWRFTIALVAMISAFSVLGQDAETADAHGWKLSAGLSWVSTSGNSETSSGGANLDFEHQLSLWHLKSGFSALQTTEEGETVAENYRIYGQGDRSLWENYSLTMGARGERNRFAGINLRSILNAGLLWKTIDRPSWKLETSGSVTWTDEDQTEGGEDGSHAGLLFSALSHYDFSESASTTQELKLEPNLEDSDDYRLEVSLSLESSMTKVLALNLGFKYRYDNVPVQGFEKEDTEATASLVVKVARGSFAK